MELSWADPGVEFPEELPEALPDQVAGLPEAPPDPGVEFPEELPNPVAAMGGRMPLLPPPPVPLSSLPLSPLSLASEGNSITPSSTQLFNPESQSPSLLHVSAVYVRFAPCILSSNIKSALPHISFNTSYFPAVNFKVSFIISACSAASSAASSCGPSLTLSLLNSALSLFVYDNIASYVLRYLVSLLYVSFFTEEAHSFLIIRYFSKGSNIGLVSFDLRSATVSLTFMSAIL